MSNRADNLRNYTEGRINTKLLNNSPAPKSTFVRMIVLDVVSDPNNETVDEVRKTTWHSMGISNMSYADVLPRNTIIAKRVGEDVDPMFCFPFFPSHLSMPCKPGECVWVMFEKPENDSDMAFWFCRITEPHISDDVNHSHPGRSFEISINPGTRDRLENEKNEIAESGKNVWHELRNGPVLKIGEDRITARENVILRGEDEDVFEKLITRSRASKMMSYESVPRFKKRPGDISLEGTNNTLVVLGTDRLSGLEKTKHEAGSIDIVTGRGQTDETFGKEASTTSIKDAKGSKKGSVLKKELNKSPDVTSAAEGDPDYKHDRSRILVSQANEVDLKFGLRSFNESLKTPIKDSSSGDASIVIKTDKIRLIARSDIEIIVTDSTTRQAPNKRQIKDESSDTKKWASIIVRSNGDIVLTPSDLGVLKLGGDDADKAVLCSTAIVTAGQVTAPPLTDTMGGSLGVEGAQPTGTFAKKVVLK